MTKWCSPPSHKGPPVPQLLIWGSECQCTTPCDRMGSGHLRKPKRWSRPISSVSESRKGVATPPIFLTASWTHGSKQPWISISSWSKCLGWKESWNKLVSLSVLTFEASVSGFQIGQVCGLSCHGHGPSHTSCQLLSWVDSDYYFYLNQK